MGNIASASGLAFFKAEEYIYGKEHRVDNGKCPRPHFCMGYILEGEADFQDCAEQKSIHVSAGEMIFVPITSRYISDWKGNPRVRYISMHFIFEAPDIFSRQQDYMLQKVVPEDQEKTAQAFEYILHHYAGGAQAQLTVLSRFYEILGAVLPKLVTGRSKEMDSRILPAISYMEQHYREGVTVEELAAVSNMSLSRFFPNFRNATGVTPIEYMNHYRVSRAIILLMNNSELSIENISEQVGFESSAYFRRVFKNVTGRTPREYRKSSMEI